MYVCSTQTIQQTSASRWRSCPSVSLRDCSLIYLANPHCDYVFTVADGDRGRQNLQQPADYGSDAAYAEDIH